MSEPDPQYVALLRRLRVEGGVDLREQLHERYLELQRGGVTPGGLPYPDPADPVAEGADAVRALAEAVDARYATWTFLQEGVADGPFAGTGATLTLIPAQTSDSSFVTAATGTTLTLRAGLYHLAMSLAIGQGAAGRSFAEITLGGVALARASITTGEDTTATATSLYIPDGAQVAFRGYKTTGVASSQSGRIFIQKDAPPRSAAVLIGA